MYQYGWFSPNGENVNFGILSKLTFHSLMKEKPLGNKVNKCPNIFFDAFISDICLIDSASVLVTGLPVVVVMMW